MGVEGLAALIRAHQRWIPFENLDVLAGRRLSLELGALQRKLVEQRRGGFCYELNRLFAGLLRAQGYRVSYLQARVAGRVLSPRFVHLCLRVELDRPYLVDVGFGEFASAPLPLTEGAKAEGPGGWHRLVRRGRELEVQQRLGAGRWLALYQVEPRSYPLSAFKQRFEEQSRSRASFFARGIICVRVTRQGWTTLFIDRLTRSRAGEGRSRQVLPPHRFRGTLIRTFGLPVETVEAALRDVGLRPRGSPPPTISPAG